MKPYPDFLGEKHVTVAQAGFTVQTDAVNKLLFKFQNAVVQRNLSLARAAMFEDVGLGKTFQLLEWGRLVSEHENKPVLILVPLAVAHQTISEGKKLGIEVKRVQEPGDVGDAQLVVTNYENAHKFKADRFSGVVLDESSILKHYSKTFFALTGQFERTEYRLCCSATPAPNDYVELANHSTFLGIMDFHDVLARWFVGKGDIARQAHLSQHGEEDFWRWVTSWAVCISHPRDLGPEYDMPGYDLPPIEFHDHRLAINAQTLKRAQASGKLFADDSVSATGFQKVKQETLPERVAKVREIVDGIGKDEPIIVWCDRNDEAAALLKTLSDYTGQVVEVNGSQPTHVKEAGLEAFSTGAKRIIISKPSIAGLGLNWQHSANMVFAGVNFSYEDSFQAIGRCRRFGQKRTVNVHVVYSESEGSVKDILESKREKHRIQQSKMAVAMRKYGLMRVEKPQVVFSDTEFDIAHGEGWDLHLGDCVPVTGKLPENSVDLTVTSLPFGEDMYTYSDKMADMGNANNKREFFEHHAYLVKNLHRITRPGRIVAVHVKDLPKFLNRDKVMGIRPFSDEVVQNYLDLRQCPHCKWVGSKHETTPKEWGKVGVEAWEAFYRLAQEDIYRCPECHRNLQPAWVLQSRITIGKDPVVEMQKTNSHGLLYMNWREAAQMLRVGLPDYVLVFRKFPLANEVDVTHDPRDTTYFGDDRPQMLLDIPGRKGGKSAVSLPVWQRYANPIWDDVTVPAIWQDINQTNVLNYEIAKEDADERHICPLQLDLIARLIQWYTNPGEVVFDPFAGVGSTLYEAVKLKRRGLGVELKPSYWRWAQKYIESAEFQNSQKTLFDLDALTFAQPMEETLEITQAQLGKATPAEGSEGTQTSPKKGGKAKRKAVATPERMEAKADEGRPLAQAVTPELPI